MQDTENEVNDFRNIQVVVFDLGNEHYAVPISQIKEVVPTPRITQIPLMPNFVRGVSNIRGNILSMIDLEMLLEISKNDQKKAYALVVDSKEYRAAVMVNQVPKALTVSENQIDTSASLVQENADKNYIRGIIKEDDQLIILVDLFLIITPDLINTYKMFNY